jgi:tetratricopeptide (TPR) repeat protein
MAGEDPRQIRLQADIDKLLSAANVERLRGRFDEAEKRCQEALLLDKRNAAAYEMLGDLQYAQGFLSRALDTYHHARTLDPGRTSVEDKVARLTVEVARAEMELERATSPEVRQPVKGEFRNPTNACLLSIICPGLGQVYNRDYVPGLSLIFGTMLVGGYVFHTFMKALQSHRTPRLWENFRLFVGEMSVGGRFFLWLCVLLLVGLYLYAAIAAPLRSLAINRGEEEVWI